MSQEDLASISGSDGGQKNEEKIVALCPSCGSKLTRRSMRRSWKDRFKSLFGLFPYRCQMCNTRFTGPQEPEAIVEHNANVEAELKRREEEERYLEEQEEQAERRPSEDRFDGLDKK